MMDHVIDASREVGVVGDGEQTICKVKGECMKSVAWSMRDNYPSQVYLVMKGRHGVMIA